MSLIVAAIATRLVTATATRAQVAHVGQAMAGSRLSMRLNARDERTVQPDIAGNGGAEGDRTPDLRNAIATLSQLSYGPTSRT